MKSRLAPVTPEFRMPSLKCPQRCGAPILEALEQRAMLYATLPTGQVLTLSAKATLVLDGTGGAIIVVRRDRDHSSKLYFGIDNSGVKFPAASIKRLEIYGGDRSNCITLDESNGLIGVPVTLFGGDGDDTLIGDLSAATFDGGDGNDSILGSSKADVVLGGAGNDTVIGGKGNDTINGGAGDDFIRGSAGNDSLFDDSGVNNIDGEDGVDSIVGNAKP